MLAHDADPLVAGGVDGMERGTYVYDATTGNVTFTTTVDTNGAFGVNVLQHFRQTVLSRRVSRRFLVNSISWTSERPQVIL